MADHEDRPRDDWGDSMARRTLIWTAILTALYAGAVFAFIL